MKKSDNDKVHFISDGNKSEGVIEYCRGCARNHIIKGTTLEQIREAKEFILILVDNRVIKTALPFRIGVAESS